MVVPSFVGLYHLVNTVKARISAQLQLAPRFELAPPLRLKILNRPLPSNKRPFLQQRTVTHDY